VDARPQQLPQLLRRRGLAVLARTRISRAPALVASSNTPIRKSLMKAALGLE
jgi:hypothetical protein